MVRSRSWGSVMADVGFKSSNSRWRWETRAVAWETRAVAGETRGDAEWPYITASPHDRLLVGCTATFRNHSLHDPAAPPLSVTTRHMTQPLVDCSLFLPGCTSTYIATSLVAMVQVIEDLHHSLLRQYFTFVESKEKLRPCHSFYSSYNRVTAP